MEVAGVTFPVVLFFLSGMVLVNVTGAPGISYISTSASVLVHAT